MVVLADESRSVLELFNVSKAARELGVPVRKTHWEITAGRFAVELLRNTASDDRRYYGQQIGSI